MESCRSSEVSGGSRTRQRQYVMQWQQEWTVQEIQAGSFELRRSEFERLAQLGPGRLEFLLHFFRSGAARLLPLLETCPPLVEFGTQIRDVPFVLRLGFLTGFFRPRLERGEIQAPSLEIGFQLCP